MSRHRPITATPWTSRKQRAAGTPVSMATVFPNGSHQLPESPACECRRNGCYLGHPCSCGCPRSAFLFPVAK